MKIGVFTDSHYSSAEVSCGKRYNSKSLGKIKEAYEFFDKEKCDLVICLGDLIDKEDKHLKEIDNLKEISEVFQKYNFKTYAILGNHDAFEFETDEFYSVVGNRCRPENIISDSVNLIFIDACFFKNGAHYRRGDSDWTDTFYPETEELEKMLAELSGDVHVFMHQNISPSIQRDHRLFNDAQVREILEKSNKVRTVYQGHYHPGEFSELNGIKYITFPAMCENEKAYHIIEI